MFDKFQYKDIALKDIYLDERNPRIVTQAPLKGQDEIVLYLLEHEGLIDFAHKIVREGKNHGAERPYVIAGETAGTFTVIEGNTRIAAYKLLTGLMSVPAAYLGKFPKLPENSKAELLQVACTIAPTRDALLSIMASAHFGQGDKSKWGYLGSRKAVFDEKKEGKSLAQLSSAFGQSQSKIKDFLIEYDLYLNALSLSWTNDEKSVLLNPAVEFNPPVRFLQTSGHKEKVGISYDTANLKVRFLDDEAKRKFKHLILKLVVNPSKGLGATATYEKVFEDYVSSDTEGKSEDGASGGDKPGDGAGKGSGGGASGGAGAGSGGSGKGGKSKKGKPHALLPYVCNHNNLLLEQAAKDANNINCQKLPAAATFLLRHILEALLKHIIDDQAANKDGKSLSLETCVDLCLGKNVKLSADDKKILKEFKKNHLDYLNMGAHASVVPNTQRLFAARDCLDQFFKRNL